MPPTPVVALPRHADLPRLRLRRAVHPGHRTALTAVLRPLVLVAAATLAILHLLPAALHAAAMQASAGA